MNSPPQRLKELDSERGFLILAIATYFFVGFLTKWQDDTWWLLRTGAQIWESKSIPQFETLSMVSTNGTPLKLHEWLFSLNLFLIFNTAGHLGVQTFCALCLGGTAILLARWFKGTSVYRARGLLILLPFFVLTLSARPQLLGYVFFAATLIAVQELRLCFLPILLFVWAQFHASVVLGLGYIVFSLLILLARRKLAFRHACLTITTSLLATSATPMGLSLFRFVFESTERLRLMSLEEWSPLSWSSGVGVYSLFVLTISLLIICKRRKQLLRSENWGISAIFCLLLFIQAIQHMRYLPLWAIVQIGMTSLSGENQQIPEGLTEWWKSAPLRRLIFVILGAGIVFCTLVTTRYGDTLGWTPLDQHGIAELRAAPQPVFTTYNSGGYALWFAPETKSFIDSRQDPFNLALLLEVLQAQKSGEIQRLFEKWGFLSAFVESNSPIYNTLQAAGWRLRWKNETLSLFVTSQHIEKLIAQTGH